MTNLPAQCANSKRVFLRDQSVSTLQAAIHSPHDPGETLERVNKVLAAYFDPNLDDPKTRAGLREEFLRALDGKPQWAVHRAFDDWVRTRTRRPSPGEIMILVNQHLDPIERELAVRRRIEEEARHEREVAARRRCPKDVAARILEEAGFGKPAAEEVISPDTSKHWTHGADDAALEQLRKARASNQIMQAARGKAG